MIFKERHIKPVIVSMPKGELILKNVDLKLLKFIMQDYDVKYK
jgi:hypothetical protein